MCLYTPMCNYLQCLYVWHLQLSTDAIEYVVFLQVPATEEMVIGTSSLITTDGYRQKCYSDGLVSEGPKRDSYNLIIVFTTHANCYRQPATGRVI